MSDVKPVAIKAVAFWASLKETNKLSGKYQLDLSQLSDQAVELLQSMGIKVHDKGDERGKFVTAKSKNPIRCYDTDGDEIYEAVGNGSKLKCVVGYYDWTGPTGKKGRSVNLAKMIVTDLVVFDKSGGGDSGGYAAMEAV
jgi:hypothetical protein